MATIIIMMNGETSLEAFLYYRRHKKELEDERTLARVWLTKGIQKPYEKNMIQSIDSIMKGIVAEEETKSTHKTDPLYIVKEGDILVRNLITSAENWVFEDGKLVYHPERVT